MGLRARFYSKRDRHLAVLAGAALLAIVLAAVALRHREAVVAPQNTPQVFLPGVAHALNAREVTRIRIVSKKGGAFDVTFVPAKGWVLPERGNYPASFEEVKKTLVAIAAMETVEPKTDRPELFHFVDLDAPPAGSGVSVTLSGEKGTLASIIIGKAVTSGDDSAVALFVRKAGDNQSWLVKSPAEIKSNQADWMDKTVVDVDRARVARVDVAPEKGPSYAVSRSKPGTGSFVVSPLPRGRELAYAGAADAVASAVTDFTFTDTKPLTGVDFTDGTRIVTHTFDGLTVTVDMVKQGEAYWARVQAMAEPGKPEAASEAQAINNRAGMWAFELPSYKGAGFAAPLESLLKPKGK